MPGRGRFALYDREWKPKPYLTSDRQNEDLKFEEKVDEEVEEKVEEKDEEKPAVRDKSDDVLKIKIEDIAKMTTEEKLQILDKLEYMEEDEYRFQKNVTCEQHKKNIELWNKYRPKVSWWQRLWWYFF